MTTMLQPENYFFLTTLGAYNINNVQKNFMICVAR